MKGIIVIKNQRGKILGYSPSQDIDETLEYYKSGNSRWNRYIKNHLGAKISYEVLKVTETPEIDVLEYKLPQVSRIRYDRKLLKGVAYRTINYTLKALRKVADWFCETYPTQDVSIDLFLNEQSNLQGTIKNKNGKTEIYLFSKNGAATPIKEIDDNGKR